MHAIKLEDLNTINESQANLMVETFKDILLDIGYDQDRISEISCRSYDGFIPYSHNKGGITAQAYISNRSLEGMGYDYGENVIQKAIQYNIDSYSQEHSGKFRYLSQVWDGKRKETDLYETVLNHYDEYLDGSEYDETQIEVRFMVLGDGTVDVDVFGSTMDAPYFRSSDYNANKNFNFKNATQFNKEVREFLYSCDCVGFINELY